MNKLKLGRENQEPNSDTHRDLWLPLISDYIDGILPEASRNRLELHLAECATCPSDLEGLQQTVGLLQRLPEIPAPRSFTLTPAQARRLKPAPFYRVALTAAALAAAFLVFAFVLDLAGVFVSPAPPVPSVAVVPPTATPTLEGVGTLEGGVTRPNGGSNSGLSADITATATAQPAPTPTPVATNATKAGSIDNIPAIRWVEIGLIVGLVLFTVFAFALRPRAPGLRLRN